MSMSQDPRHDQPSPPTDTAGAAQALCDRLMEHTGEMISVLERETALLQRGKPHEITALQARKTALSTALTHDMSTFRRDSEFIKQAVPDRVDALKEQHLNLQKSLTANQDALTAMKAVSESLLQTVAARVAERSSGPEVYGKDASLSAAKPASATSISLDESL